MRSGAAPDVLVTKKACCKGDHLLAADSHGCREWQHRPRLVPVEAEILPESHGLPGEGTDHPVGRQPSFTLESPYGRDRRVVHSFPRTVREAEPALHHLDLDPIH